METLRITTKVATNSLRNSTFWIINFGVIAICYLSGPFGTLEALPNGFRLIYWGSIVLTTNLLALWMHALIRTRDYIAFSKISIVSIVFGLLVAGVVILISLSLLPPIQRYPGHTELLSYSFPSATVIFLLSVLVIRSMFTPNKETIKKRPALLDRLKKHSNAQTILLLSAQDHYVEITTELGTELCLLRLSDAIAEVSPKDGFQIHRSHWVAKSAVVKLETKGSIGQAQLVDGRTLKVSQSRLAKFNDFMDEAQ